MRAIQGGDFELIAKLIHTAVAAGVQALKFHPIQPERLTSATEAVRVVTFDNFRLAAKTYLCNCIFYLHEGQRPARER